MRIDALRFTAVMYGAVQLVRLCKDAGVTPIVGNEMYVMHVLPPEAAGAATASSEVEAAEDSCNLSPPNANPPSSTESNSALAASEETHDRGVSPSGSADRSSKDGRVTHQNSAVDPGLAGSSSPSATAGGGDAGTLSGALPPPEIADADDALATPKKRTRKTKDTTESIALPTIKR